MKSSSTPNPKGFSLVNTTVAFAILGLVAMIAIPIANGVNSGARHAKLKQDVKSLNSSITFFVANGGNFDGLSDPQDILERLKAGKANPNAMQFVGMSGSSIDPGLSVKKSTGETSSSDFVAMWNPAKNRFDIVSGRSGGVSEFYLK